MSLESHVMSLIPIPFSPIHRSSLLLLITTTKGGICGNPKP